MSERILLAHLDYMIWRVEWTSEIEGWNTRVDLLETPDVGGATTTIMSETIEHNPFGGDAAGVFELYCREAMSRASRSMSISNARRKGVEI